MLEDNENDVQIYKSFYGIIPGSVRYDPNLCPNAKLMYCEITALCDSFGVCWAGNSYFAELYNVSTKSVSNWIGQLEKNDYIRSEYTYKKGTKAIDKRRIYVPSSFYTYGKNVLGGMEDKFHTGMEEKFQGGIEKKFSDINITYKDNINNIYTSEETISTPIPASIPQKEVSKKAKLATYAEITANYTNESRLVDAINNYISMRVMIKKPPTNRALELVFKELDKLAKSDTTLKIEILEQSILKNWTDVYAVKNKDNEFSSGAISPISKTTGIMQGCTDYSGIMKRGGE